jgi:hypothetical protein
MERVTALVVKAITTLTAVERETFLSEMHTVKTSVKAKSARDCLSTKS